jgi:general secretion pathway protein G
MIRSYSRSGVSLLEVIAAAIILSVVVTATVATIVPIRVKSEQRLIEQQLASLNSMSQTYFLEQGEFPPQGIDSLIAVGYLTNEDSEAQARNAKMRTDYRYRQSTGTFLKR